MLDFLHANYITKGNARKIRTKAVSAFVAVVISANSGYRIYSDLVTLSQRQDVLFPLRFEGIHVCFRQDLL
jgi:hypothetical protein